MNIPVEIFESDTGKKNGDVEIEETFLKAGDSDYVSLALKKKKFRILRLFICVIFLVLLVKLGSMQANTSYYRSSADRNRARSVLVEGLRGNISDRLGNTLVTNVPSFALYIDTNEWTDETNVNKILVSLSRDLNIDPDNFKTVYSIKKPYEKQIIPLNIFLTHQQALYFIVKQQYYPGIKIDIRRTRKYLIDGEESLSHILGYIGRPSVEEYKNKNISPMSFVGRSGIEQFYDDTLRGQDGRIDYEYNVKGKTGRILESIDPMDGKSISLTIDSDLQKFSEKTLKQVMLEHGSHSGSLVIMNPQTGEILSIVSEPTFNSNVFTQPGYEKDKMLLLKSQDQPLFNRVVNGQYPSGSTIKPFISIVALDKGIINDQSALLSTGGIYSGKWFFPDWKAGGHGVTNLDKAIAESVNTFFYTLVGGSNAPIIRKPFGILGVDDANIGLKKFGWGSTTGIDLPEEADGLIPNPQWKTKEKNQPWYIGDTYHMAIGQGDILVTPLQLAAATSIIANGGYKIKPHLVVKDNIPNSELLFTKKDIGIINKAMRITVTSGSARRLLALPIQVAAKTGTAQIGNNKKTNSWLISYGPYDKPTLAIVALVEEGGEGGDSALFITEQIYQWWFEHRLKVDK